MHSFITESEISKSVGSCGTSPTLSIKDLPFKVVGILPSIKIEPVVGARSPTN